MALCSVHSVQPIRKWAAALLATTLLVTSAEAQTWTWKKDGNGNWSDPLNWNAPPNERPFPNGFDHVAVFGNAITANRTVTLDVNVTLGTLKLDDNNGYTIESPAGKQIKFPTAAAPNKLQVVNGEHSLLAAVLLTGDLEIDVATGLELKMRRITGAGKVIKKGAGKVFLTEKQNYRGATILKAGTIKLGPVDNCLPIETIVSSNPALGEAGTLEIGAVDISGPGFAHVVRSVKGDVALKNPNVNLTAEFTVDDPANNDNWSGVISGFVNLYKHGKKAFVLSGSNAYVGITFVYDGTLKLAHTGALGPMVSLGKGIGASQPGVVDLVGIDPEPYFPGDGVFLEGEVGTRVRNTALVQATFEIGAKPGVAHLFQGTIEDAIALDVVGLGQVVLTGANTYTGGTTVSGNLEINNAQGSGTGPGAVDVEDGGTLSGHGSISGAVTVEDLGRIKPGSVGLVLMTGALTLKNAAVLAYFLDAPNQGAAAGNNTFLFVNGGLTLDGVLNVTTGGPTSNFGVGRYRLIQYTGALTDNGLTVGALPAGFAGTIDAATIPGAVDLVVTPAGP